ncbi:SDR family NAD(P)-dependent oxidoreductase [Candidatus Micrarchaeota archaeon]|nr:SDR family NAD(P)-dependent oxidoreductase [Candidatus Micrarchaeota archaeon]
MRVMVTGGAGFIGSNLVDALLARGDDVVCYDNFDNFYDPAVKRGNIRHNIGNPKFALVEGDVRDKNKLKETIDAHGVEGILHMAGRPGVRPSLEDPNLYQDVNVNGTINVLDAMRNTGVRNLVFASSSSVYGVNSKVPFSEDDPIERPISPYAASKRAAELFCYTYHHLYKLPVTCVRIFTSYGPRQKPEMAISKFVHHIHHGKEIPFFGDGTSKRDYTFISDTVDGLVSALDKPHPFEIVNLGSGRTVELSHLVSLIEKHVGKKAKINRLPDQPGDVPLTYADIGKARRLLGYEPKVGMEDGIRRFVDWFRQGQVKA